MFPNARAVRGRRASVRGVGHERRSRVLVLLLGILVAVGGAGCTRAVPGTPAVAAPHAFPVTPAPATGSVTAGSTSAPTRAAALEPDVLTDECLLDAAQFGALLGRSVRPPEQSTVHRDDGSRGSSCYVTPAAGPTPLAALNVYRVRAGTPAEFVRAAAAGGRALTGLGEAAAVLDTAAGPTLQAAGVRYLVTIVVQGRDPGDDAWRAAGRTALARLPP